jgi:hypothetical protein
MRQTPIYGGPATPLAAQVTGVLQAQAAKVTSAARALHGRRLWPEGRWGWRCRSFTLSWSNRKVGKEFLYMH